MHSTGQPDVRVLARPPPHPLPKVCTVNQETSEQYRPPPRPEGILIRTVREAAGRSVPECVAAVRAAGGKVSTGRWSQVETGSEIRFGLYKRVRASSGKLAWMAAVLHITPGRLATEGERPDAARVLEEILRTRDIDLPWPLSLAELATMPPGDRPLDPAAYPQGPLRTIAGLAELPPGEILGLIDRALKSVTGPAADGNQRRLA